MYSESKTFIYLFMVDLAIITGRRVGKEVIVTQVGGLFGCLRSGAEEKHE